MLNEQCGHWACATLLAMLLSLHPWAAFGACFGCCFFMVYPPEKTPYLARFGLGVFSWGLGYAHGVFWYPAGPPYDPSAMLPAAGMSVIAVVLGLVAVRLVNSLGDVAVKIVEGDGPLPGWVGDILDRIPFIKRRGGGNDL